MNRKMALDQPVMARAIGLPSPSTEIQRCQARDVAHEGAHALSALAEDAPRVGVGVERLPAGRDGDGGRRVRA